MQRILIAVVLAVAALVPFLLDPNPGLPARLVRECRPTKVMGTSCRLLVVGSDPQRLSAALADAEAALRQAETLFSDWIDASAIGRLNHAKAGQPIALPEVVRALLDRARKLHHASDGAFDATCGPLVQLWRQAGRDGRRPDPAALADARALAGWTAIELSATGAIKRADGARIDLGGIAKGWGIDQACAALLAAGATGGLVDVGGDLRVVGTPPAGLTWTVAVQHPDGPGTVQDLAVAPGLAVCTSGDYARFVTIDGVRYSHIVDTRSGEPVRHAASVTVIAADTETADGWATALSVLGPAGFARLPEGLEAMIIRHEAEQLVPYRTPGFPR